MTTAQLAMKERLAAETRARLEPIWNAPGFAEEHEAWRCWQIGGFPGADAPSIGVEYDPIVDARVVAAHAFRAMAATAQNMV